MRKIIYTLILLLTAGNMIAQNGIQPQRKKVAVVLSGGGAKGVAHIGALKVIEEAGIPIDYIVGTSMGAIIGGLYSIGYTPAQMDSLVSNQNWSYILSDAVNRNEELLVKKQRSEQYTLSVPFKKTPKDAIKGGVISGKNIAQLFSDLTIGYHDSIDFNKLPTPFACVAVDIVTGQEYVFHSGKLALAMRSSMSIPGAFTPVKWNNMVLVDGGMINNYPVDVARRMGAEIIIGVDVQSELEKADNLNSLPEIAGQIINILGIKKYNENVEDSDVHIHIDTSGYSAASFNKDAITVLKERGEHTALQYWESLIDLKKRIGISPTFEPKPHGPFVMTDKQKKDIEEKKVKIIPEIDPGKRPDNTISVGVRFDNESLAALILNTYINLNEKKNHQAALTIRLGRQTFGRLDYTAQPFHPLWNMNLAYQFSYNDLDLYNQGKKTCTYSYLHHLGTVNISRSWNSIRLSLGAKYEYFKYDDILLPPGYDDGDIIWKNQHQLTYFGQLQFDSYNRRTYPTKGMKWNVMAELYTDNGINYKNKAIAPIFSIHWEGAYRVLNRLTLLPWVSGRAIINDEYSYAVANMIGGNAPGRYLNQQIPFVGIDYMELAYSKTFVAGLRIRQKMGSSQYVSLIGNFGVNNDEWNQLFKDTIWGCGVSYGYDTFLGPLEATFSYSNVTKGVGAYISLGYTF